MPSQRGLNAADKGRRTADRTRTARSRTWDSPERACIGTTSAVGARLRNPLASRWAPRAHTSARWSSALQLIGARFQQRHRSASRRSRSLHTAATLIDQVPIDDLDAEEAGDMARYAARGVRRADNCLRQHNPATTLVPVAGVRRIRAGRARSLRYRGKPRKRRSQGAAQRPFVGTLPGTDAADRATLRDLWRKAKHRPSR